MRKTLLAILTMASIQLFADRCDPCPQFCPPCPPQDCAYNAPYSIDLPCQWDLFVTGSFIWWEAKEENLSLGAIYELNNGVEYSPPIDPGEIPRLFPAFSKKLKDFEFQYCPGFQVGLGYNVGCDNWQIYGEYTYLRSNSSSTIGPVDPVVVPDTLRLSGGTPQVEPYWNSYPYIPSVLGVVVYTDGYGKWNLDLDIVDLQLSREYFIGQCLTFRSFASIRAAWIDQKFNAVYNGFQPVEGASDDNFQYVYNKKATTKSWGVGPRVGLDTDWFICNGFRIFANSGASLLYTKYSDIKEAANFTLTNPDLELTIIPIDNSSFDNQPCYIRPQADITLGVGWGTDFCNSWYFDLEIGYTFNIFWSQNMFIQPKEFVFVPLDPDSLNIPFYTVSRNGNELKGGDLTLQGLVVKARLDF